MSHPRHPLKVTILAAAVLVAFAATGAAASARIARFWVTVRGQQTTTWNEPFFIDSGSCYGRHWTKANGHESFSFRSRPTKLLITSYPGTDTTWSFGTWLPIGGEQNLIRASGTWTTERTVEGGELPGKCGGSTTPDPAPLQNCGTRQVSLGIGLDTTQGDNRELFIEEQIVRPSVFCPQFVGTGATQEFTAIPAPLPDRELFDRRIGKEIILGHRHFTFQSTPRQRPGTASTTTSWTLTLTRAR